MDWSGVTTPGGLYVVLAVRCPQAGGIDMVDPYEAARTYYQAELAAGIERFFEPRRESCRWCGSTDLSIGLRTPDLLQHKPGRFTLEQCGTCCHIFQNPRLTPAGLDFYYRDFYEGLSQQLAERLLKGASAVFPRTGRDAQTLHHASGVAGCRHWTWPLLPVRGEGLGEHCFRRAGPEWQR